jgi:dystroglycan 1
VWEFGVRDLTQFHCREGRRGSIQVDGEELISGKSPGPNVAVNTKDSVYVGES